MAVHTASQSMRADNLIKYVNLISGRMAYTSSELL
jgi:hypothetical protein